MGRINARNASERAEKSVQSMSNIMTWAEKITGEAPECAVKSAQSMSNIMMWAEKITRAAPERAKMSAKYQNNISVMVIPISMWYNKRKQK